MQINFERTSSTRDRREPTMAASGRRPSPYHKPSDLRNITDWPALSKSGPCRRSEVIPGPHDVQDLTHRRCRHGAPVVGGEPPTHRHDCLERREPPYFSGRTAGAAGLCRRTLSQARRATLLQPALSDRPNLRLRLASLPRLPEASLIGGLLTHELPVPGVAETGIALEVIHVRPCIDPDDLVAWAGQARGRRLRRLLRVLRRLRRLSGTAADQQPRDDSANQTPHRTLHRFDESNLRSTTGGGQEAPAATAGPKGAAPRRPARRDTPAHRNTDARRQRFVRSRRNSSGPPWYRRSPASALREG